MMIPQVAAWDVCLKALMNRYLQKVPDARTILRLLESHTVTNDHIAFRSIAHEHLGISSLERIFLKCGYTKRDAYSFETKKLNAYWYAPPKEHYPRVFLSELRITELSDTAQDIFEKYTKNITSDPMLIDFDEPDATRLGESMARYLQSPIWTKPPVWDDYTVLLEESEYAAWVLATNSFEMNHFTISVDSLSPPLNDLASFNEFLIQHDISLNQPESPIQTSGDGLLLQSSTKAAMMPFPGASTTPHFVPSAYVEFAERKVLPQYRHLEHPSYHHRRDGFETSNADTIFESTSSSSSVR